MKIAIERRQRNHAYLIERPGKAPGEAVLFGEGSFVADAVRVIVGNYGLARNVEQKLQSLIQPESAVSRTEYESAYWCVTAIIPAYDKIKFSTVSRTR